MSLESTIFRQGSTTYYWSSVFFPRQVRDDVFKLYSFVRVVDNLVDSVPQDTTTFELIQQSWREHRPLVGQPTADRVVTNILQLSEQYDLPADWIDAFMASMRWDADGRQYHTIADSLQYVYGSAEVIGLMMARVLGLPSQAADGARLQGRAMQWINFCRDIREDVELGRCYFPRTEMDKFGLSDLTAETAAQHREAFQQFMGYQLDRYATWQREANQAHALIPRRLRVPIGTASAMYDWTADQIRKDPFVVYQTKVKPTRERIVRTALLQGLHG